MGAMKITESQYRRIEACFPHQRGNVSISNLEVLNAILYVAEHGCKWRGLPLRFGNWHTIYTRMNRWAKAGVLDRVFAALQDEQIIRIKIEALSLDSTIVKVHPDGTGALKKRPAGHRQVAWRLDYQDSYGCRRCSNRDNVLALARPQPRRAGRTGTATHVEAGTFHSVHDHGPGVRGGRNTAIGVGAGVYAGRATQAEPC